MVKVARKGGVIMVEESQTYFLQVEDMITNAKDRWDYEEDDNRPLILKLLEIQKSFDIPNYPTIGSYNILSTVGEQLNLPS